MKPRSPFILFALAAVGVPLASLPARAQTAPAPKAAKPAPPKEIALEGELRLDGKLTVLLGTGQWMVEAVSWTSPKGVLTNFEEPKTKTVMLNADAFIHPHGEFTKVALPDVTVGTRVAIIGKNQPDGTVKVREVVLLEGFGPRKMVGVLRTNPETSRLIDQARKLSDLGQTVNALQLTQRAADTARGMGDASGEALATNDLARLYNQNDQPDKAMEAYLRCETLGRALSNPLVLTLALRGKAAMLLASDQIDEAIKVLQEADPISLNAPPTLRPGVLQLLASAYCAQDQPADALGVMQKLAPLQAQNGQGEDALETRSLMAVIQSLEDGDAAKATLDEVVPRIDTIGSDQTRSDVIGNVGVVLWRTGDKENADVQFEKAAKTLEAAGKKGGKWRGMAKALEAAGDKFPAVWAAVQGKVNPAAEGDGGDKKDPAA